MKMYTTCSVLPKSWKSVCLFFFGLTFSILAKAHLAHAQWPKVMPSPHRVENGFQVDQDGKVLLAVPKGMKDDGNRHGNLSVVGKKIEDLELAGFQKVYFDCGEDKVIVRVVVSENNVFGKVLAATMAELLKVVQKSDVNQVNVFIYLGEQWVPADRGTADIPKVELQKHQLGPCIAASVIRVFSDVVSDGVGSKKSDE